MNRVIEEILNKQMILTAAQRSGLLESTGHVDGQDIIDDTKFIAEEIPAMASAVENLEQGKPLTTKEFLLLATTRAYIEELACLDGWAQEMKGIDELQGNILCTDPDMFAEVYPRIVAVAEREIAVVKGRLDKGETYTGEDADIARLKELRVLQDAAHTTFNRLPLLLELLAKLEKDDPIEAKDLKPLQKFFSKEVDRRSGSIVVNDILRGKEEREALGADAFPEAFADRVSNVDKEDTSKKTSYQIGKGVIDTIAKELNIDLTGPSVAG